MEGCRTIPITRSTAHTCSAAHRARSYAPPRPWPSLIGTAPVSRNSTGQVAYGRRPHSRIGEPDHGIAYNFWTPSRVRGAPIHHEAPQRIARMNKVVGGLPSRPTPNRQERAGLETGGGHDRASWERIRGLLRLSCAPRLQALDKHGAGASKDWTKSDATFPTLGSSCAWPMGTRRT